jgi:hypothetical protein
MSYMDKNGISSRTSEIKMKNKLPRARWRYKMREAPQTVFVP